MNQIDSLCNHATVFCYIFFKKTGLKKDNPLQQWLDLPIVYTMSKQRSVGVFERMKPNSQLPPISFWYDLRTSFDFTSSSSELRLFLLSARGEGLDECVCVWISCLCMHLCMYCPVRVHASVYSSIQSLQFIRRTRVITPPSNHSAAGLCLYCFPVSGCIHTFGSIKRPLIFVL